MEKIMFFFNKHASTSSSFEEFSFTLFLRVDVWKQNGRLLLLVSPEGCCWLVWSLELFGPLGRNAVGLSERNILSTFQVGSRYPSFFNFALLSGPSCPMKCKEDDLFNHSIHPTAGSKHSFATVTFGCRTGWSRVLQIAFVAPAVSPDTLPRRQLCWIHPAVKRTEAEIRIG